MACCFSSFLHVEVGFITLVLWASPCRTPELCGSAWGHGLAASSARTPGHVGTAGLSSTTAQEKLVVSLW